MGVSVKNYVLPEVDRREWFRYMGAKEASDELCALAESCLDEAESCFHGRVCYCEIPVPVGAFGSHSLEILLEGCDRVVVFAATVGLEIDRLIAKYSRVTPAKALCLQALGTERIEALCDLFCAEMQKRMQENGEIVTKRFSPGYGDLPLQTQKEVFRLLDCPVRIGLTLNESLLMSPAKSVTAIMGIRKENL
ncbi:MAG: hypothetical protein IKC59_05390 [Clostridia bacterium]|nr:hypothetical protein [Clostridia bacterium]